jgi:hypothetical protein
MRERRAQVIIAKALAIGALIFLYIVWVAAFAASPEPAKIVVFDDKPADVSGGGIVLKNAVTGSRLGANYA